MKKQSKSRRTVRLSAKDQGKKDETAETLCTIETTGDQADAVK